MAAGKRWTSMPKRVLFMAILIPVLGVSGAGSEVTGRIPVPVLSPPWRWEDSKPNSSIFNQGYWLETNRQKAGATS